MSGSILGKFKSDERPLGPSATKAERPPLMIDFQKLDGNRTALHSNFLLSIEWNPSEGVRLTFSTHQIVLHGRNLEVIYEGLVQHAVSTLVEVDERHTKVPNETPVITRISIARSD